MIIVVVTKLYIDNRRKQALVLSHLFLAEALFLTAFMIAGLSFELFTDADSLTVALTGSLGLTALAICNTASKTVIKGMSSMLLMIGNMSQLGIGLSDYIANRSADNAKKLGPSAALVISFVIGVLLGAVLYVNLSYWAVGLFVIPVLYLSLLARNSEFLQHIS